MAKVTAGSAAAPDPPFEGATAERESLEGLPHSLGRYQVLGLLGTGGMAEVLLARLTGPSGFERPVVIKRILPHLAREKHFVDMFLDEARIVAGIRNQNVVQVHELVHEQSELFLVMEYLEGESAASLARRLSGTHKLLSFGLAAHILAETCAGLNAAHNLIGPDGKRQNLVHRDVSPANIFVTYAGEVKVIDFGIAVAADRVSRTDAGQVKGKYAYMSPEQCMGQRLDARSDIFSLGIVLYEMSTCRRLFRRTSDMLTLQAICHEDVVPPSRLVPRYPASLEAVVLKALSRDKERRYQSAAEMRRDLVAISRELNANKVPEEALSKVMHKVFPDRIEQKLAMLSSLREGRAPSQVPVAESDEFVDIPAAAFSGPESEPSARSVVSIPEQPIAPAPWAAKKGAVIGMGAAVLLGAIGVGIWATHGRAMAPSEPAPVAAAEPPRSPVEPPAPVEPRAPALAKVSVRVETEPSGAEVLLGEERVGLTPLELQLEKGGPPETVSVRMAGYRTLIEKISPDVDQRLRLTLIKSSRTAGGSAPEPALRPPRASPEPQAPSESARDRGRPVEAKKDPEPRPAEEAGEDPYQRFN
jgi:serine/threonine protein kinase